MHSTNLQHQRTGKQISLISKKNIRYLGTLYSINEQNATVALQNVRSFGTEGRASETPVAASADVHPFLVFRGQDITDLHVHEEATTTTTTNTAATHNNESSPATAAAATTTPPAVPPKPAASAPPPPPLLLLLLILQRKQRRMRPKNENPKVHHHHRHEVVVETAGVVVEAAVVVPVDLLVRRLERELRS